MKAVESGEIRLSSTAVEQYLPSTEMARLLELSDNELTRLARSAVLVRERDPLVSRSYVYPVWQNVRAYILHVRARREGAQVRWLEEKNRTVALQRKRAALELAIREGRLVDKEQLIAELTPRMLKIREAMEQALAAGVSRHDVERICGILDAANEGIGENGSNGEESV